MSFRQAMLIDYVFTFFSQDLHIFLILINIVLQQHAFGEESSSSYVISQAPTSCFLKMFFHYTEASQVSLISSLLWPRDPLVSIPPLQD